MRRRPVSSPALRLAAAGAALALAVGCGRWGGGGAEPVRATLSASAVLGGADTAGFARAAAARPFRFPADHGPHPGFRNEWWYFTGNLVAGDGADGRRFGYELTFFRTALVPQPPARASDWAASEVYMAHFALTDSAGGQFLARERFERGGSMALAGAYAGSEGLRVWLDDWSAASVWQCGSMGVWGKPGGARSPSCAPAAAVSPGGSGSVGIAASHTLTPPHSHTGFWPLTVAAQDSGMALHLSLGEGKPPVLQGDRGLSRKGAAPGDASYYYSLTRMPTRGWLEVGGRRYVVSGESWMDREWSTSALGRDEVGWDWLALQLSDGRELMLYRIRRRDGTISPFSGGTLVGADGRTRALAAADARVDVTGTWASPRDGTRYPARWRVRVPSAGLDLDVRPILPDQELNLTFRYWEGAVNVIGRAGGREGAVAGHGYVELTGYGRQPAATARVGGEVR